MATAEFWADLLPSPYDIEMTGWTRVHTVESNVYDLAKYSMTSAFGKIWRDMDETGKKEFLERNGIMPADTRIAAIEFSLHKKVRLCIMAPLPQEVKVLFHLTFNEPESAWRL